MMKARMRKEYKGQKVLPAASERENMYYRTMGTDLWGYISYRVSKKNNAAMGVYFLPDLEEKQCCYE